MPAARKASPPPAAPDSAESSPTPGTRALKAASQTPPTHPVAPQDTISPLAREAAGSSPRPTARSAPSRSAERSTAPRRSSARSRARARAAPTAVTAAARAVVTERDVASKAAERTTKDIIDFNAQGVTAFQRAGWAYLDACERAMASVVKYQERAAEHCDIEWLAAILRMQAQVTRGATTLSLGTGRRLLR